MASNPPNLEKFSGSYQEFCQCINAAQKLVVVDFSAEWCPPCRRLGEVLPSIAESNPHVQFLKIDIDESRDVSNHYSVSSIPHIKFLKAGQDGQVQELASVIGADIPQIKAKIGQFTGQ